MSRIESFTRMFERKTEDGEVITSVEIPLIQRDYAQGRRGEKVDAIRKTFLAVLHGAVAGDDPQPVGLDFVYGERKPNGTLQPLDGQQRLTTLFLLHWYFAAKTGNLALATGWTNFSYETRPSARRFCQRLVAATPPVDVPSLSNWVREEPWYLFVWRHDPTINSMLVMIDAIDEQFADVDAHQAWDRLTDINAPAVSFHLLPLPDMGSAEDLYVKMNSRGKPLTDFENFKARFEKVIEWSPRVGEFALKADTTWSDLLWTFRGDDDLVDDEFLRYFEFITEICEWTDDQLGSRSRTSIIARAGRVFGSHNARKSEHLDFLFTAFDVWANRDIAVTFESLFRPPANAAMAPDDALPLFFRDPSPNLFESACRAYGETTGGGNRNFTFGQTLLLLAVVLHLANETGDFSARLRTLRNLIEGSQFEMRAERMSRLVADTRALIIDGDLPEPGSTFAVAQISDEFDKREFLLMHPESADALRAIEDNHLLRGSTTVFALDETVLAARGAAFNALMANPNLWWDLTGAMLTFGEYQWPRGRNGTLDNSEAFQFGTWDSEYADAWREVFVGRTRSDCATTSKVLGEFLDAVAVSGAPLGDTLQQLEIDWLKAREDDESFDWRYYLVKYRSTRVGASGLYYAEGRRMGFGLTNLPGGKKYRNAHYRDPYIYAIFEMLGQRPEITQPWFSGYEWEPRWLRLTKSGVGIRALPSGFEVARPTDEEFQGTFDSVAPELDIITSNDEEPRLLINLAKATDDPFGPDAEDRVLAGARIIQRFIEVGL